MRAARRSDFPDGLGQWKRDVDRKLRQRFTVAATDYQKDSFTTREILAEGEPDNTNYLRGDGTWSKFTGTIAFENTDAETATTDDEAVTVTLTKYPLPGSLHVRHNGIDLAPDDWTLITHRVTVEPAADLVIRDGDEFTTAYAYDPVTGVIPPPEIEFVGATTAPNSISSIPLPVGAAEGDLIVLVALGWSSASSADPRLTGDSGMTGSVCLKWGYEDGSGLPVDVDVNASAFGWATTICAVFRGVVVADIDLTQVAASPMELPTFPDAYAAIGVLTGASGTVAGGLAGDSTGQWADRAALADVKTHAAVHTWENTTASTSPPGSFAMSGDITGGVQATLLLEHA